MNADSRISPFVAASRRACIPPLVALGAGLEAARRQKAGSHVSAAWRAAVVWGVVLVTCPGSQLAVRLYRHEDKKPTSEERLSSPVRPGAAGVVVNCERFFRVGRWRSGCGILGLRCGGGWGRRAKGYPG
ncbi:hypothetical protein K490DRAFT_54869 [Saccharata proteae CBS 121410]|uniref:Uncharacterized protein n=1 Tax=Saccharata proteae CBS 121410 TaxID=1314787 RepID=A0A6A5YBJ1_9PEZI|nr:hypothetical protein K490DRAFT_54869 [Saccharata proteae CBS 121410]